MPDTAAPAEATYRHIDVAPLTRHIGAEISGVDFSQPLSEAVRAELHRALMEREVIFFRDLDITPEQQLELAGVFGSIEGNRSFFNTLEGHPDIEVLENDAKHPPEVNVWHSDITWRPEPPMGTCLYAKVLPATGGDTMWASMTAAYEALSPRLRAYLDGLTAIHTWEMSGFTAALLSAEDGVARFREAQDTRPPVEQPVIRTHPVTGKKLVYVNPTFTHRIAGVPRPESRAILDHLFELAKTPEFQVRFKWRVGSLAIWDNRATQHYAVADYYPEHRLMHRITIAGDTPFGETADGTRVEARAMPPLAHHGKRKAE
jgi:taurine dioxygenase